MNLASVQDILFKCTEGDIEALQKEGGAFCATVGPNDVMYFPAGCVVSHRVHSQDIAGVRLGVLTQDMYMHFLRIAKLQDENGCIEEALKFLASKNVEGNDESLARDSKDTPKAQEEEAKQQEAKRLEEERKAEEQQAKKKEAERVAEDDRRKAQEEKRKANKDEEAKRKEAEETRKAEAEEAKRKEGERLAEQQRRRRQRKPRNWLRRKNKRQRKEQWRTRKRGRKPNVWSRRRKRQRRRQSPGRRKPNVGQRSLTCVQWTT